MRIIAYNEKMLDIAMKDIYEKLSKDGSILLQWEKPYKDKTEKQLGFIFSALIDSVKDFYEEKGEHWDINIIKENFYQACSFLDDRLKKIAIRFNGQQYEVPKRLSEMNREETSLFIDKCLYLIDNAKCFTGLVLHPSIRYTWIRHISKDDLFNLKNAVFPREDKLYLEHLRKQHCICCGIANQSQVHHLKVAGLSGTAYKSDDVYTLPLCQSCHISLTHGQGQNELIKALHWIVKYMPLEDFCRLNYLRWRNHK
jgi:hypothetical protein